MIGPLIEGPIKTVSFSSSLSLPPFYSFRFRFHMNLLFLFILSVLSFSEQSSSSSLSVGFYQSPSYYKGFPVTKINTKRYNVIKYSFVNINNNTFECSVGDPFLDTEKIFADDDEKCKCCARGGLNQLFNLKRENPHLRTMLSVGGWVWSTHFSEAAANPERRKKFASSCIKIMQDYGLDGIDIDWEFPGGADGKTNLGPVGSTFKREDTENLIALFTEFRTQFKESKSTKSSNYLLTFDVHSLPFWYLNKDQISRMNALLDWYNVMNYEYALDGIARTRHTAGLYANPQDQTVKQLGNRYVTVDSSMKFFLSIGVPPEKLVMGIASFGRKYTGVNPSSNSSNNNNSNGLYQSSDGKTPQMITYQEIVSNGSALGSEFYDDIAKAAFKFNPRTREWTTYENPISLTTKMNYINEKGLAGVMFWDVAYDSDVEDQSLAQVVVSKLKTPNLNANYPVFEPLSQFCNVRGDRSSRKSSNAPSFSLLKSAALVVNIISIFLIFL